MFNRRSGRRPRRPTSRNHDNAEVREAFNEHIRNIPPRFIDLDVIPFRLVDRDEVKQKCIPFIDSITETDIEQHTSYANQRREDVIRTLVKGAVKYAALSHTWRKDIEEEFTYQQMKSQDSVRDGRSWQKLEKFVELAKDTFDCKFAWVDTACVDRTSSEELQAAAASGFDWFRNAHVCIVYLSRAHSLSELEGDRWFQRGWPLTELLASVRMKFYGVGWKPLNVKRPRAENDKADSSFLKELSQASGISVNDLRFFLPGPNRVREKLTWASERKTDRPEDAAYCLISIFASDMQVKPDEGKKAFSRLMLNVIPKSHECDVFAWAGKGAEDHPAIPSSPTCYGPQHRDRELHPEPHHYRLCGDRTFSLGHDHLRIKVILLDVVLKRAWAQPGYTVTVKSRSQKASIDTVMPLLTDAEMTTGVIGAFGGVEMSIGVIDYSWIDDDPGKGRLCEGELYFGFLLQWRDKDRRWKKVDTEKVIFIDIQETKVHKLVDLSLLCRLLPGNTQPYRTD